MILRHLALLALAVVVAGPALMTVSAGTQASHAAYAEAVPCPDPGDDGAPCRPSCPCSCCPGHVQTLAFATERIAVAAPLASELEPAPIGVLHSNDQHHRIFHPPRT